MKKEISRWCSEFFGKLTRKKILSGNMMETDMKRCLGTWDLMLFGVGQMIGGGIYVLSGTFPLIFMFQNADFQNIKEISNIVLLFPWFDWLIVWLFLELIDWLIDWLGHFDLGQWCPLWSMMKSFDQLLQRYRRQGYRRAEYRALLSNRRLRGHAFLPLLRGIRRENPKNRLGLSVWLRKFNNYFVRPMNPLILILRLINFLLSSPNR